MKAIILVGGFGTRLRPLTLTRPKPLVEFGNVQILYHQIHALSKAGVKTVILATSHLSKQVRDAAEEYKSSLDIEILFTEENEPLGTAGPIALSREFLLEGKPEPFFVMNSDIICNFPLRELMEFHTSGESEATILTTEVEDPSKFGVVRLRAGTPKVECFIEKPLNNAGRSINAGIYVLNPSVLDYIPCRPTSIEREVFPKLAREGKLSAFPLVGFWSDIGEPIGFMRGTVLYLESLKNKGLLAKEKAGEVTGNVLIHPSASVGVRCKIGPNVVIGHSVMIGDGVRISNSVIMSGCTVCDNAHVESSIIASRCTVGRWARVSSASVIGENVRILEETLASSVLALPNGDVEGNINVSPVSRTTIV